MEPQKIYLWTQKRFNGQLGIYEKQSEQAISFNEAQKVEDYYDTRRQQPEGHYQYILSDGIKSRTFYSICADLLSFIKTETPTPIN